jgi:hypothetical protein
LSHLVCQLTLINIFLVLINYFNIKEILSNLTVLIIHINSTCAVIKINPEIVTGQYNSCAGISKVIFPSGCDLYWFQSSTNQNSNFY